MTIEATSTEAPAAVVTTATEAPVAGATTAAATPAVEAFDLGKLVSERLGKDRPNGKEARAARAAANATAAAATTQAATVAAPPVPVAVAPKEEAKPADAKPEPPADDLDARLARLATASADAAKVRKEREQQRAYEARSKALDTAHEKELAQVRALTEARTKGDIIGALRAAGYTDEELRTSFPVAFLEQLGKVEEPKALTQADVDRLFEEREAKKAAAAKEAETKAAKENEAAQAEARDAYFYEVHRAYRVGAKLGDYPAITAENVTDAQLDQFFHQHAKQTGVGLKAKELLDLVEKRIIANWSDAEKKASALREAAAKRVLAKHPAPAPATAPTRPATAVDTVKVPAAEKPESNRARPKSPDRALREAVLAKMGYTS